MSWLTSLRSALGLRTPERARQPTRTGRVVEELSLWRQFSRIGGGLTPGQVSAIVREADGGDPRRLMDLANEARQKDGHLQAVLGQSEETLAALPWQLVLHDDSRLKDRKARDWADQYLRTCPSFRRLIAHLAGATYYGFAVSEILWTKEDGRLVPSSFEPLAPRRFGFRQEDGLFVWRDEGMRRDGVDFRAEYPWKFVVSQPRVTGDVPCREGLVRVLMWAALFRNWTLTDWVRLGEIAWKPWRIGTYKKGAAQEDIDGLVNVLDGMSTNGVATVPDSVTVDVKWAPHSSTKSTHEVLFQTIGSEMSKAVLGQTETTEASQSSGLAQAKVHQSVRGDLLEARARCIAAELTRDVLAPMILLNFGDSAVVPEFQFVTQDKQDFKAFAEGVKSLKEAGTKIPQAWVREQAGIPEPQDGEELLGDPEIPVDVEESAAPTNAPPPATAPDARKAHDPMHEEMVARSHGLHVRAVRTDAREATFIASTDAIDSYDEIVEQSWRLERFVSNPVILYAHQSRELPIGTASDVKVVGGHLECTIRFLTEDKNPRAEQVWKMVRDGELRAVSVGFVPHTYRWEKRADREVLVLGDNELLEISVVPIPANPEALAKARAKAIAEAKENRDHVAATAAEEKSMEIEQLKARVAEGEAALSEAQEKLAASERTAAEEKAAAEAREAALMTERDAALERAATAEAKLVDAEVEALVGLKILPAEKEAMTALAKKDRASFEALVRARPELKLLTQAVPTPTKASAPSPFADPSEELAARAERASE